MSYPMLAPSNTWYKGSMARNTFTTINIVDIADEATMSTATESWAAAVDSNGDGALDDDIMCYVNGTTLTIAGNGSGKIYANPDSMRAFSGTSTSALFSSVTAITGLDVLDVSKVIDAGYMFAQLSKLTTLEGLSDWDTSNIEIMHGMFGVLGALKELDVSKWNTRNATSMAMMFYGVTNLTSDTVDVSNWDVSKVTTFDHMFAHSYMSNIDTSNWVTSSATNLNALFHSVQNTTIDVSNFDTSNVTAFTQMFQTCSKLTEIIGLENFDTSNGIDFQEMFLNCSQITELDLSNFDTRKAKNGVSVSSNGGTSATLKNMFSGMNSLQKVTFGENFSFNGDGSNTTAANVGKLPTPNNTYIANADGNWYTVNRTAYAPADIPNNTAATYYASVDLVNDIDYLVKNGTMLDIADAIRIASGTEDRLSPSAIPESILSIPDVNLDEVYEAGKQAEYNRFWDTYQQDGNRTEYRQAFAGFCWTPEIFKPKYDMHVTNGYMMFMHSRLPIDLPDTLGVKLDFSDSTSSLQYTFNTTLFTRIGVVDGRKSETGAGAFFDTFCYSTRLHTIDKIVCDDNTTFSNNCFVSCSSLSNITFEGTIGKSINFQWCPLTKESITNIIEHLSPTATGQTCTFKKSAKEAAFTADEWAELIATKTNWTFSLV